MTFNRMGFRSPVKILMVIVLVVKKREKINLRMACHKIDTGLQASRQIKIVILGKINQIRIRLLA